MSKGDKKKRRKEEKAGELAGPSSGPATVRLGGRPRMVALRRRLENFGGAQLCYGEVVKAGERQVIPVARVRGAGGFGFGDSAGADGGESGSGGGGGGYLDALPLGYIEVGPEGTRFVTIEDPEARARALRAGAAAAATLITTLAGLNAARGIRDRARRRGALSSLLRR